MNARNSCSNTDGLLLDEIPNLFAFRHDFDHVVHDVEGRVLHQLLAEILALPALLRQIIDHRLAALRQGHRRYCETA